MVLVVDTHALIWFLADDPRLGREARQALQRRENIEIIIPIIVLFEIAHLQARKNISISLDEIHRWIAGNAHVKVYPADMSVLDAFPEGLEIHDALIVATVLLLQETRKEEVVLATTDLAIIQSALVKTLW